MKQKATLNLFNSWKIWSVRYNERMAVKFSDRLVALTGKDKEELNHVYGAKGVEVIAISLPDEYISHEQGMTGIPPAFLFIGDNWFPNIHGIRWFIKNVLDHVDIKMQIAGRNMERYRDEFSHPKIEFLGFVDDLPKIIGGADYFLCPIFTGGGMKVKICEALMHGKNIIGTREAFEGYDLDLGETGAVCNTAEEFIDVIRKSCPVRRERFNPTSRRCFLEKYSFNATLDSFRNLLH